MANYRRPLSKRILNRYSAAAVWAATECIPRLLTLAVLGVMILMTLFTIGEMPSGPAAAPSSPTLACSDTPSVYAAKPNPEPCTLASRAAQGLLAGGVR